MPCPEKRAFVEAYTAAVKEYARIVASLKGRKGADAFNKGVTASDEARRECERCRLLMRSHSKVHGC
jgi:hypothetical protein